MIFGPACRIVRIAILTLVATIAILWGGFSPAQSATYYVDPTNGNDSNAGTLSSPWASVAKSIAKLAAGDTLYLRGGTYWEKNISIGVSGTEANPITVKSYPGEKAIIDGGLREFRSAPNTDWEVVDSSRGIYRSKASYSGLGILFGMFESGGKTYRLVPYENYANLASDNEYYVTSGSEYVGPGVCAQNSRVYVRLKTSQLASQMGFANVPSSTDPGTVKMTVYSDSEVLILNGAAYLTFDGIGIKHQNNAIEIRSGTHHVNFKNCDLLGGRTHVMVRDGAHDLVFDSVTIPDRMPDWISWTDVKHGIQPAHSMQSACFNLQGSSYNIEIKNSTMEGTMDGIDMISTVHSVHVHHNIFNGIRDDCFQIGTATYDVEVDHNKMLFVSKGPSTNGNGTPPKIGAKYVHHNIIDCSRLMQFGRKKSDGSWEMDGRWTPGDGKMWAKAFGTHDVSTSFIDPWKIYNNTVVFGHDGTEYGAGYGYRYGVDKSHPHEVYNNIFVLVADSWAGREANVADGSQIDDGNLFFRKVSNPQSPLFRRFKSGGSTMDFQNLAAFKSSKFFQDSKAIYAPGFENSSVEGDPQLDSSYQPSAGGPAASGGVALPAGFPGNDYGRYRGAIAASGSVAPITVSMTSPADKSTVSGTVNLTASASSGAGIIGVQFQVDGANVGSQISSAPYSWAWNTAPVSDGTHTLTAVARDSAGSSATSSPVTVTVSNYGQEVPPVVSITAPPANATVSGVVALTAAASSNYGIYSVQFQIDGSNLGLALTAAPYTLSWNTPAFADGSHTLTAIARDKQGNSTTSSPLQVTVNNNSGGSAATLTFKPVADATVQSAYPTTNYGSANKIQVDSSPSCAALMKFSISGVSGRKVTSAKLRLSVANASNKGGDFHRVTSNSWDEGSVTWNNRPAWDSAVIGSLGAVVKDTWVEINVTPLITGDGIFSLCITTTSKDGVDYRSREVSASAPQLILTVE